MNEMTIERGQQSGRAAQSERLPNQNSIRIQFEPVPAIGAKGPIVRNRIGTCALEMFALHGYEGSSTRLIAQKAGVGHTALLYHFETKQKLWEYVLEGAITQFRAMVARNISSAPQSDPETALREIIEAMVNFTSAVPQFHKVMMLERTQANERMPWIVEHQLRPHFELVVELITTLQKEGRVVNVEPMRLYYSIVGICGILCSTVTELRVLQNIDILAPEEIRRTKEFLEALVFVDRKHPAKTND